MNHATEKTIFTVSQLNRRAKQLLETHLPLIWVSGEISNLAKPSSGHWYFSLKDDKAQVRCAMFRNANQRLKFSPEAGQQVLIRARVSLYEGRGEYQVIAEHMEAAGAGLLQQQYEALKTKLTQEGLFDEQHKQALPQFPQHIGIITSPTGAAIHDILSVLQRRYPIANVTVIPVSVQGEQAVPDMLTALERAQKFNQFDVLIIGRGGGSIEDLWAFNNEQLVRAMAACPIALVSAVGHEVDFTLADFVADKRAPTPSASAEMISPDLSQWQQTIDYQQQALCGFFKRIIEQKKQSVVFLQKRLRHPGERIATQKNQLLYLKKALHISINQQLSHYSHQLNNMILRYKQQHPSAHIQHYQGLLVEQTKRLKQAVNDQLIQHQQRFNQQVSVLNAMSPLAVLARGYSITSQKEGDIIRRAQDVNVGDEVLTQLGEGSITSVIKSVKHTS